VTEARAARLPSAGVHGLRVLSLAVAAVFAAPLAYLVVRNAADLERLLEEVGSRRSLEALGRSLLLATTVALAAAVLGTGAAWLVARTDLPGRRLWRVLLPLPLVLPSFIAAFALIAAFAPGGLVERLVGLGVPPLEGFDAAFLVLALLTYPYVYLPCLARLAQLPRSLEESSRLLGRRGVATFVHVVLPQVRGAILAGALLAFLYALSDFGAVQLLRYDTLTPTIYATRLLSPETSLALSLVLGVLAVAVAAGERAVRRAPAPASARPSPPLRVPLGRWKAPALVGLGALVGFALAAPVAVLAYWAVRGVVRGSSRASSVAGDPASLIEPALNTAGVSIAAAVVAVAAVLPVAYLTARRRDRFGSAANAVIVGGFALPGLAVALALVYWTLRAPWPIGALYQTLPLLVLAYTIHFGAQSLRATQVSVAAVPNELREAASGLGAGRTRRFVRVEVPLTASGLLAGGGLVLLSAMKELPATLLLAPPGFQTLATKIWVSTEDAFLADASIASLLLIALSAVLTWLFVFRGGRVA
jgi:iron(III) transport system permease protein